MAAKKKEDDEDDEDEDKGNGHDVTGKPRKGARRERKRVLA